MTKTERATATNGAPAKQISFSVPESITKAQSALQSVLTERANLRARAVEVRQAIITADLALNARKAALSGQLLEGGNSDVGQHAIRDNRDRKEYLQWQAEALEEAVIQTDEQLRQARSALRVARDQFEAQFMAELRGHLVEACKPLREVMTRGAMFAAACNSNASGLYATKVFDPQTEFAAPLLSVETVMQEVQRTLPSSEVEALRLVTGLLRQADTEIEGADRRARQIEQQKNDSDRELRISIASDIFGTLGWNNHPLTHPLIEQELARRASRPVAAAA